MGSETAQIATRRRLTISLLLGFGLLFAACMPVVLYFVHINRLHPAVVSTYPTPDEVGVTTDPSLTLLFNKSIVPETITPSTFLLRDDRSQIIPARQTYQSSTHVATLIPAITLLPGHTYQVTVLGGTDGIKDKHGHPLSSNLEWKFTTGITVRPSPTMGPGGPILLLTSSSNGFSQYYAEILRNEGFNEFEVGDPSQLNSATLAHYDVVLLGEVPVNTHQISILSQWVEAGGNLIAMHPESNVANAFPFDRVDPALTNSLHDAYIKINNGAVAGAGLVQEPIQFHGPADPYLSPEGAVLATFYKDAMTATPFPAVVQTKFGNGNVVLFSYDLARSVVYTRQGNPLWSGMERDGIPPIRSDDLFYGASVSDPQPDWVDLDKVAIPQADEQQRLLANVITLISLAKRPLPHFWYLPRGLKATIVMTGDDHGHGGTVGRFETFLKKSPIGCSFENWECIRGTSNIFVGSISPSQADALVNQGFEIGLHVYTKCADWPSQLVKQPDGSISSHVIKSYADSLYDEQLAAFAVEYPGVPKPVSNRTDCITWGDYDTQPQVELKHGIRLDTNYYYWPAKWVKNRPGFFTGSGMPMRFAKRDGSIIDVYQATTQMTDESQQVYPFTIDTFLANALGTPEYYGVFTANMHTDESKSPGANAIINAALSHHIPIITAAQMLKWLDGRNASSFQNLTWSDGQLGFTIEVGVGGNGIQALLPIKSEAGDLVSLTLNGGEVIRQTRVVAGLGYAVFSAAPGSFIATYRHIGK